MANSQAEICKSSQAHFASYSESEFERKFGDRVGSKYCLAVNSGTSAIHLALLSLGVGSGDEVICPTNTYVATVNPIIYCGAKPIFVDSEQTTWNMCSQLLEQAIISRSGKATPKAIIVVHINGMPTNLGAIFEIARNHGIPIIEDAAQALGSKYNKNQVGTLGVLGAFSFNDNKIVTTYGGGMLVTNEKTKINFPIFLSAHAKSKLPFYEHTKVGFNYRMNRLAAEYGLEQLPHLENNIFRKRQIWKEYRSLLQDIPGISFQEELPNAISNRWISAIRFEDSKMAVQAREKLSKLRFGYGFGWRPMHQQPVFSSIPFESAGVADDLFESVVHLPSHVDLSPADQGRIVQELHNLDL